MIDRSSIDNRYIIIDIIVIIMLIISIFIVSVIGSPKPKCLCYIVLSGCRPVVPQYLLLMPLDLHQDDGAVDYYKD